LYCNIYKQYRTISIRHSYTYKWILILIQACKEYGYYWIEKHKNM
jgi:hypothetical protein